jgi:cytosine/adenosine deaminase-related metal-dependent hydrolase
VLTEFQPKQSSERATLVIRGCDVLARPGELREDVDVAIAGDRVLGVTEPGADHPMAATLDGRGLIALPGLVNAHTHSPENCLRGAGEGLELEVWLTRMFGTAGPYSPEDHYVCALAGAVEMLLSGTTGVLDHLWMTPPTAAAADAVLRAYRDAGMRAAVAPLVADTDSTGPLAEAHGCDLHGALFTDLAGAVPADECVAQLEDLIGRWHGAAGGRLQVFAGPGGLQWCSDELLLGLGEVAARHESSLTIHLLESKLQDAIARNRFGTGAVEALDRLGLLGPGCSLAHGVWLDDPDIELIADRGAAVVHNPAANLRLGSGRAPVSRLLDAGVLVALGADGSSSSDNQNMWTQLKLASLVHNVDTGRARWVGGSDALAMAGPGGAAVLGLGEHGGRIEPGAPADIALVDRRGSGLAGAQEVEAALALSETGRGVVHVLVAGELVVAHGRCLTVDERAVRQALFEQAARRAEHAAPAPHIEEAMRKMAAFKQQMADEDRTPLA